MAPRVLAVVVAGLLCALGIILGAATQEERVLTTDPDDLSRGAVAGNLVPLTGLLTAAGATAAWALTARAPWRRRLPAAAGAGALLYLLVQVTQAGLPNYIVVERHVNMSLTLLASNTIGGAGVMAPVLVLVWAAIAGFVLALRRLFGRIGAPRPTASHTAWTLAAVGPLAAAVWGPIEVLLALPAGSRHAAGHSVALAASFAAILGLLVLHVVAQRVVARAASEPRLADWGREHVRTIGRLQVALAVALAVAAAAGSLMQTLRLDVLYAGTYAGTTFGTDLRTQYLLSPIILLPLVPAWRLRRRAMEEPEQELAPEARAESWIPAAASVALAGIFAWTTDGALWPWVAAAVAPLVAGWPWRHRATATQALWTAYILWAFGNTVTATFVHNQDITIRFDTSPGINALWQLAALVVAGLVTARAAAAVAREPRAATRSALAFCMAGALGIAAWLELPLAAWQVTTFTGEGVAIGSLPASQDGAVRAIMHIMAAAGVAGAAVLAARLYRPEWFGRRRGPAPDVLPVPAPAPRRRKAGAGVAARSRTKHDT